MKRQIQVMACGIAATLAAVLIPQDTVSATRSIFEDDEPRARSGLPGLRALKEEGKKLAKEVVEKVSESYYNVAKHTPGFEAVYTVEEDGRAAGKINISADFTRQDPLSAKFEGELKNKKMNDSIEIMVQSAWVPLYGPLRPGNPTATRSEDGFLISDQAPPSNFVEAHMVVSADHRLKQKGMVHKNGAKVDYIYRVQTVDGKHFVESMDSRTVSPPVTLTNSFVYTYARREGVAIIKRLDLTRVQIDADAGEKEQAKCLVNLDNVTFKKAAAPIEVEVEVEVPPIGAEADWDDLSRQVIAGVIENTLDFTSAVLYLESASCTIDIVVTVQGMAPSRGTISYSWEDVDLDGALTEAEVSTQIESVSDWVMRQNIQGIDNVLKGLATSCGLSLFLQRSVTAQRTRQGYQLTLKTQTGDPPVNVMVTEDFRMTRGWTKALNKAELVTAYRYAVADGKKLLTGMTLTTTPESGAFGTTDRWTLEYVWMDGVPLLSEANIISTTSSIAGAFQSRRKFTMRDWKVTKREQPLRLR